MDFKPTLEALYPEGSHGGQCFSFLHKIVDFPGVGDSLSEKKKALQAFGIPLAKLDAFRPGDIILTTESFAFGHGAFVNALVGTNLRLTEANYHLDEKVHHTRLLSAKSSLILGVFRGKLRFKTLIEDNMLRTHKGTIYALVAGYWIAISTSYQDFQSDFGGQTALEMTDAQFNAFPVNKRTIK